MKAGIILAGCVLGSMLSFANVRAQSDGDFKGKTIRLIIGTSSGGGVDLYATRQLLLSLGVSYLLPTGAVQDLQYISVGGNLQFRF